MRASQTITKKPVPRYFAEYVNTKGGISKRGFSTKVGAARAVAREFLLDQLHGEKEHKSAHSGEWGWYERDWDLGRMKWIFNCQWTGENGIVNHRYTAISWDNEPVDTHLCEDDGKAFCAAAWMQEIRRIAKQVLAGEELTVSWWVIERAESYIRQPEPLNAFDAFEPVEEVK